MFCYSVCVCVCVCIVCVRVCARTHAHTSIISFSWVIIREGQFETLVGSVDLEGKTSHRTICFNKSKIHRLIRSPQGEGSLFWARTGRRS